MTFDLLLEPQIEAKLIALAQEKGVTADELVYAAIHKMIVEATQTQTPKLPVWHLGGAGAVHRREIY
jgi:hypothetical protein